MADRKSPPYKTASREEADSLSSGNALGTGAATFFFIDCRGLGGLAMTKPPT
ncbi:MAG: hypothetical protein WC770_03090 [Phycisphaerae bacterium]